MSKSAITYERDELNAIIIANGIAPGVDLVRAPTPLEHHSAMSRDLDIEVFIKREDLADSLGCGNKLRKLSYVVAEAEREKATMLVTMGSLRSNQCKAVAAVAALRGLGAHVVYGGDKQERPQFAQGSYLLTSYFEPTLTWCERRLWRDLGDEVSRVMEYEKSRGERPWFIPAGASDWPGLLGSVELGFEIAAQAREAGLRITDVIVPAGSGGTSLGIHLAAEHLGLPWRVLGFCIGENVAVVTEKTKNLLRSLPLPLRKISRAEGRLVYDESACGLGYDMPRLEELSAMRYVVRHYGLLFDPNYMIKAYLGLRQAVASGRIRRGSQVILVHTGGQMGLFDSDSHFTAWFRNQYPLWIKNQ